MSAAVTVPPDRQVRLLATVSGESTCTGDGFQHWCTVRILVDGVEMEPAVGTDFAFASPGGETWQSGSLQRVSGPLGPGVHTIVAQFAVRGAPRFTLDDAVLSAVAIQ